MSDQNLNYKISQQSFMPQINIEKLKKILQNYISKIKFFKAMYYEI